MEFKIDENSPIPIYEQIMNGIIQATAYGDYDEEGKLPSVRELAVFLKVNPNTVSRAYYELIQKDIIFVKRGIGNYINKNAKKQCMELIRNMVRENISREIDSLKRAGFSQEEIDEIIKDIRREK